MNIYFKSKLSKDEVKAIASSLPLRVMGFYFVSGRDGAANSFGFSGKAEATRKLASALGEKAEGIRYER